MPRQARAESAAGIYHVYARGNNRERIFGGDQDRRLYLALVAKVTGQRRWHTMSYCLMENHVHLLIETTLPNLGAGMGRIQGAYAQAYNRRHGRCGHLFQGRFGATAISSDAQLLEVSRYIACNPVEAEACALPEDWPWSSHSAVIGRAAAPAWLDVGRLLEYFGAAGGDPAERYERFVAETQEAPAAKPGPLDQP